MPRIPGTFNGGVPANLVWDPLNPPLKCPDCGMVTIHLKGCEGLFTVPMVETEVELINENREWARIGMNTAMVTHDFFKMNNQIKALVNVLKELIDDGQNVLDEAYRRCAIDEMKRIRIENEEAVKRANLGIGPSGLIGPDGNSL